jgi:hypothetical protein
MVMSREIKFLFVWLIFSILAFPRKWAQLSAFARLSALRLLSTCVIHHAAMAYAKISMTMSSSYFIFFCLYHRKLRAIRYVGRGWLENKRLVPSASNALPLSTFFSFFFSFWRTGGAQLDMKSFTHSWLLLLDVIKYCWRWQYFAFNMKSIVLRIHLIFITWVGWYSVLRDNRICLVINGNALKAIFRSWCSAWNTFSALVRI